MRERAAALALVLGLAVAGHALGQWPTYTVDEPFDWEISTPREEGVKPKILKKALRRGGKLPYLHALLVVKDGRLIAERYYRGAAPTDAHTVMSVSKSFISALAGIAVQRGDLRLNQPMMDFFPDYSPADLDPRKYEITIRHLLTMTSGLPYDDHDEHWSQWMPSPDWVGFCLDLPLDGDPGVVWNYSTCGTHLLSAVVTRATGRSSLELAREHLFEPLGITIGGWRRDPQGNYRGGWDMYFTPRDMARFGQLYLERGEVDGERILRHRWTRKTTRPYARGGTMGAIEELGYGYLWWTGSGSRIHDIYLAAGYAGQFIVNVPELGMTIVAAADANYDWDPAGAHFDAILDLIVDRLLVPLKEQAESSLKAQGEDRSLQTGSWR